MLKRTGSKFGDTLIEVTIAIGIFSMVAIAVVSVISASTTGAQTALEITLTREEIDSQAEAIRFIQESYASALSSTDYNPDNFYKKLWDEIGNKAITKGADGTMNIPDQPSKCQDIYEKDDILKHAFVVNTRKLGDPTIKDLGEVIVPAKLGSDPNPIFQETTTYPRLYYNGTDNKDMEYAEGIYVFAVKDPESTNIAEKNSSEVKKKSAYYDLYIRSCWYAAGAETPNTISTIIRIYNPAALQS